jgi:hypothetical protein
MINAKRAREKTALVKNDKEKLLIAIEFLIDTSISRGVYHCKFYDIDPYNIKVIEEAVEELRSLDYYSSFVNYLHDEDAHIFIGWSKV